MLKVGLPIALAVIMFGMGLGLTVADFTRMFSIPNAFLTGALLQIISLTAVSSLFGIILITTIPVVLGMLFTGLGYAMRQHPRSSASATDG